MNDVTADKDLVATSILLTDAVEKKPFRKLVGRTTHSFLFTSITVLPIPIES